LAQDELTLVVIAICTGLWLAFGLFFPITILHFAIAVFWTTRSLPIALAVTAAAVIVALASVVVTVTAIVFARRLIATSATRTRAAAAGRAFATWWRSAA